MACRRKRAGPILHDNPQPIGGRERSYRGIFDLCIEGLYDSDRVRRDRDLIDKRAEYAVAGVREYYVLHHRARYLAFWRLGGRGIYEPLPVVVDYGATVRATRRYGSDATCS